MSRNAVLLVCLVALGSSLAGCDTVDKGARTAAADRTGRYDFKMRTPVVLVAEPAARRAQVEGEIVRILRARGVQAVPSHTFVPKAPVSSRTSAQPTQTALSGSERISMRYLSPRRLRHRTHPPCPVSCTHVVTTSTPLSGSVRPGCYPS